MTKGKLYDIPSLPYTFLKQKYIGTKLPFKDKDTVLNYQKELLMDTRPEKPIFEHEILGSNQIAKTTLMNVYEHGGRYTHDPYHPEMFLGDLTADPRGTENNPNVSEMAEQARFRQERYIKGKLQNSTTTIMESAPGSKRMVQQARGGHNDTISRMSQLFDDSSDGMVRKASGGHNGKRLETIGEDQAIYQVGDEKILPHRGKNIINELSNKVGIQWDVQPDNKFSVSSISNLYRSKGEVDRAAAAIYRMGDNEQKFTNNGVNKSTKSNFTSIEQLKQNKKNLQSTEIVLGKDMMENKALYKMLTPSGTIDMVSRSSYDQKRTEHMKSANVRGGKLYQSQERLEQINEIKYKKEKITQQMKTNIPKGDKLMLVHQAAKNQQKQGFRSEDKNMHSKPSIALIKSSMNTRKEMKNDHKFKQQYANKVNGATLPNGPIDHIGRSKHEEKRKSEKELAEISQRNIKNKFEPGALRTVDDFELDQDPTMNNDYLSRKGNSMIYRPKFTRGVDADNQVSPVNDTVVPFRTRY
jgi:hypothetical protein